RTRVTPVMAFEDVSVRFVSGPAWARRHTDALAGLSLEIAAGETLGVVGESGSGKTTLGRLALGLLRPTAGRVRFGGKPVESRAGYPRGSVAAVLQHPQWSLNPRLSIGSSIAEPLTVLGGCARPERQRRVAEMMGLVGLDAALLPRYPHELSGGQRQRASIARALITHPRFIVFDEATSALDVSVQAQILNLVLALQQQAGFAALFISHDLAAVRYVARRVTVLYAGRLMELAESAGLYRPAAHPYTRCLQQASGLIDAPAYRLAGPFGAAAGDCCPLHPRCPLAVERCARERPVPPAADAGRVACHRAAELANGSNP
ncbi:MAG: ABC transporter ATP-binding protein, partial [Dongiaceae bacterium]